MSPPSLGAWIEMISLHQKAEKNCRRPPRGGRGLKFYGARASLCATIVAPLAGGVD